MKKFNGLSYLVVLGAASLPMVTGCGSGGGTTTATTSNPPPPSSTVSITAKVPAPYAQLGVNSPSTYVATATVTGASNTSATWSSSNGNIATIDSATGAYTPSATNTGTVVFTATASADTSKTATVSVNVVNWVLVENQINGLALVDMTSGKLTSLMANNQPCTQAVWSYDHLNIACIDYRSNGPSVIGLYTTDGTPAGTKLTSSVDLSKLWSIPQVNYLAFSRDGTKVFFSTEMGGGVQRLFAMTTAADTDGNRTLTLLHEEPASMVLIGGITVTPDGKQILLEDVTTLTLYAINVDGSNYHQLIAAPSVWAMYSPDMTTLYYTSYSGGVSTSGVWSTYVQDVATGTVKTISGYEMIAASPNGRSIIVTDIAGPITDSTALFVADADGGNVSSTSIAKGMWASW